MNNKIGKYFFILSLMFLVVIIFYKSNVNPMSNMNMSLQSKTALIKNDIVPLPIPILKSNTSIEEALLKRRSIRKYKDEPLDFTQLSQLLWAAQGVTQKETGHRTAPSAGALYPLELYVAVGNVNDLEGGIYKYHPKTHSLEKIIEGDKRIDIYNAALEQSMIKDAPCVLIFSAVFERTTGKYGERGSRYVYIEVGHAAQNVYLQTTSLNLGAVVIGAFDENRIKTIINMPNNETPLYIMPVGKI